MLFWNALIVRKLCYIRFSVFVCEDYTSLQLSVAFVNPNPNGVLYDRYQWSKALWRVASEWNMNDFVEASQLEVKFTKSARDVLVDVLLKRD